jgi:hypothetical protein
MKFDEIRSSIETKLGEENVSLIADDMASLITFNKNQEDSIKSKDEEIERLKSDKEKLILANGNLLKQVPMGKDDGNFEKEEKEEKTFSFRSIFDEKGNIRKSM